MVALLLASGMAQGAAAQERHGFTTADLAAAARAADGRAEALAGETERLRLALAYDPALGLSTRTADERAALLAVLPTGAGAGDLRVQWLMAGAIAQPGRDATTVLYNPLARAALALDWVQDSGGWHVAHAWLSSAGAATWPADPVPWRHAFVADYVAARAAPGDAGAALVPGEADRWLGGLVRWLAAPGGAAATDRAQQLIAAGHTARADGGNIDLLPARVRAAYRPIGAMARRDGGTAVLFGATATPQILIAADFDAGARLQKLSLLNLGNAGAIR